MQSKMFLGAILAAVVALGYAFTVEPQPASAGYGKNLEILPDHLSKKQIKGIMKKMAKALGVECEHCHDMDDMAKDTKQKKIARDMMRMTQAINKKHLRGYDGTVSCMTCHRGKKKPSE